MGKWLKILKMEAKIEIENLLIDLVRNNPMIYDKNHPESFPYQHEE